MEGELGHRAAPHASGPARPVRPDLTDRTPAPLTSVTRRPRAAAWATNAWSAGALLLTFASVTMLLTRNSIAGHLGELLRDRDVSVAEATLKTASSRVVLALLGALVVTTILAVLVLRRFTRRSRLPRLLMVPVWLLDVVVALMAALVVPTTAWQGWLLLGSLALSIVVLLCGCFFALGPGVRSWLLESRRAHLRGS